MEKPVRQPWFLRALLVAVFYLTVGIGLGALAGGAASARMLFVWRLAAWLISGLAFAVHVWFEQARLHRLPRVTAWHAALAAALGAFFLAVSANVHGISVGSSHQVALLIALVAWPVITAVPAYFVAFGLAVVLARWQRNA